MLLKINFNYKEISHENKSKIIRNNPWSSFSVNEHFGKCSIPQNYKVNIPFNFMVAGDVFEAGDSTRNGLELVKSKAERKMEKFAEVNKEKIKVIGSN